MTIYDPTKIPGDVYDTHTHLNDDALYHDVAAYVGRAHEFRVMEMNVVGYDPQGNQRAIQIAHDFADQGIRAIIGFQPEDTDKFDAAAEKLLRQQLNDPTVIGVGETGLDWHWKNFDRDQQLTAFEKHLDLAAEFDLPVTIHMRDSFDDVYRILQERSVKKFEMHSFAGTVDQAEKLVALGGYISFSGMATFKNTSEIHEAAKSVPLDRILVETDAPYLAPVPKRGQTNEPAWTKFVVDGLAKLLEIDRNQLAKITRENAYRVWPKN
ncbi:TatD family hydrolase [Oenococcus sicerae]|uniref:TatD family deoxyribonuclease n=1 Tax=Oenococcus sicerae TaxID=2203724 RepID=A0AAJ1VMI2_9LACO|nr:TatD family hydrolase [Oenococcus sicerae]MDN6900608.1 TatD family deoxyribonuclease [Oenococcus sicerae]